MSEQLTIYHNPRCSKSRQTLAIIEKANLSPNIILYLDTPPTSEELKVILNKLKMKPRQLLRKNEEAYKKLNLADDDLSDAEIITAMIENPKLIERPIVVRGTQAILGRPSENVEQLITT